MVGFLWVAVLPGEAREGTVSSGRWDTHLVTEVRRVWVTIREGPGLGSQAVGKGVSSMRTCISVPCHCKAWEG